METSIVIIVLMLVLSAFFSGSETALTAASKARMLQLEKSGDRLAQTVGRLIENRERLIGALLLGNNLVNILAASLATRVFLALFGQAGVAYATLVMTVVVLVFAEVLPKTLAIGDPDRFSRAVAPLRRRLGSGAFWLSPSRDRARHIAAPYPRGRRSRCPG